jgi:pyrroloquinoline quinone (PQQ) biosynthesis protein C
MKLYDQLVTETSAEKKQLYSTPIIQSALAGTVSQQNYLAFLTQAYHHVKHTVPLIMACGSRLTSDQEWLRVAMAKYIEEELGHQEWILNDINAAGGDATRVRNGKPHMATELMVSYAYDIITRKNPVGFLGMIYVLESTSTELATGAADILRTSLGLPDDAFSYLYSHGSIDIEHIAFFEGITNKLTQQADRLALVNAARVFYYLYGQVFLSLHSNYPVQRAA